MHFGRGVGRSLFGLRKKIAATYRAPGVVIYLEPSVYEQVNWSVNHDHPYRHYAARDFRELKPGEPGNCAAIAYTKKLKLARHGTRASVTVCALQDGEGHAFLVTDPRVLDNRFDRVISLAKVGCE